MFWLWKTKLTKLYFALGLFIKREQLVVNIVYAAFIFMGRAMEGFLRYLY